MARIDDYKSSSKIELVPKQKNNLSLYVTIFLLVAGFLVLIAFVFAFSSSPGVSFFFGGRCIAIVNIDQEITTQSAKASLFSEGQAGSEEIANIIYNLDTRDDVVGVLFVINSPGGGVVATREIYDSIKELKKPKVAYFREVAASGGYYIATPTDYIVADPNAITGSIGVVATFSDMSELFEKVGLNMTSVTSGEHKDIGSPSRPMTVEEKKIIQDIVDEVFVEFKSTVLENRKDKLNREKFEEVLDGRILSGRQAKQVGLVDQLGSKRDALKKVAELAGIPREDARTCEIKITQDEQGLFGLNSFFKGVFQDNSNGKVSLKFE